MTQENNYRFGVGLLVVAAATIGLILILFFGSLPSFFSDRYQVTIRFPSAPKVSKDTPVRKNGVQIGRVASVKLLDGSEGVNLVLDLDRKVRLVQGETCRIATGSLITGDSIVEFIPPQQSILLQRFDGVAGGEKNGVIDKEELEFAQSVMADGDYLTGGQVAGDPLDILVSLQGNFGTTLAAIETASRRVDSLASSLENVLGGGQGQVQDVAERFRFTIDNFNNTVDTIDRVAQQFEQARLPEVIGVAASRLPILFDEASRVLKQTQNTLAGFDDFSKSLETIGSEFEGIGSEAQETVRSANQALRNINAFTEPLPQQTEQLVGQAVKTLENLDSTLADLRQFSTRLNSGDGTLARLIEDDQLYYSVIQTLQNVERISSRLQPIVDDVRVITDKVARDPGQLGVRGALRASPNGAGFK